MRACYSTLLDLYSQTERVFMSFRWWNTNHVTINQYSRFCKCCSCLMDLNKSPKKWFGQNRQTGSYAPHFPHKSKGLMMHHRLLIKTALTSFPSYLQALEGIILHVHRKCSWLRTSRLYKWFGNYTLLASHKRTKKKKINLQAPHFCTNHNLLLLATLYWLDYIYQ